MSGRLARFKTCFFPPVSACMPFVLRTTVFAGSISQALLPFCMVVLFTVDFLTSILIEWASARDSSLVPLDIPRDPSTVFPVFRLLDIGMRVNPARGAWASCPVCEQKGKILQFLRQKKDERATPFGTGTKTIMRAVCVCMCVCGSAGVIFGIDNKCLENIHEENQPFLDLACTVLSLDVVVARLCGVSAKGRRANQCVVVCECK